MEEIEREHIMQVQAESPTLQDAAESLRYQRHYPGGTRALQIRHVCTSDAGSPTPMSVPKSSKALLQFEIFKPGVAKWVWQFARHLESSGRHGHAITSDRARHKYEVNSQSALRCEDRNQRYVTAPDKFLTTSS
jgi:hypothetical protein